MRILNETVEVEYDGRRYLRRSNVEGIKWSRLLEMSYEDSPPTDVCHTVSKENAKYLEDMFRRHT